jgi:hypothetical protein
MLDAFRPIDRFEAGIDTPGLHCHDEKDSQTKWFRGIELHDVE